MLLYKAEDTMYKLKYECNYNSYYIIYKYIYDQKTNKIPFIKFTSNDRDIYDRIFYMYYIYIIITIIILIINISTIKFVV